MSTNAGTFSMRVGRLSLSYCFGIWFRASLTRNLGWDDRIMAMAMVSIASASAGLVLTLRPGYDHHGCLFHHHRNSQKAWMLLTLCAAKISFRLLSGLIGCKSSSPSCSPIYQSACSFYACRLDKSNQDDVWACWIHGSFHDNTYLPIPRGWKAIKSLTGLQESMALAFQLNRQVDSVMIA